MLAIGGDVDGDGTLDLVIDLPTLDLDWERELSSVTRIESGRTGESFFQRSTRGSAFSTPAGDLDGAPGDDLYLVHFEWMRQYGSDVTIFGIGGATGVVRWSRADAIPVSEAFALIPSLDQTGDGRADAVYSRAHFHSEFEGFREFRVADASRIDGLDGPAGVLTWGFGDTLAVPPEEGAVAGLIIDESGAPVDACVAVFTVDGDHVGQDSAGPDGTYRVGGLLTGLYKLQIWDCLRDTLVVEYYRDHPDLDSADPVAVEGGQDTTGIDVTVTHRGV